MKRLVMLLSAFVLAALSVVFAQTSARADDNGSVGEVARYHVTATVAKSGQTTVEVDMDYDFGHEKGHGPFVVLVDKMRMPKDPDHWRNLPIDVKSVTSGTGAPTELQTKNESQAVVLRIGRKGTQVTGKQNYKITYTIKGLIEGNNPESRMDELNWQAVGAGWEVPLNDIKVTVKTPMASRTAACFSSSPCTVSGQGSDTVTTSVARLGKGKGLQVVSGYPGGSFSDVEPILSRRYTVQNMFPINPGTLIGGGVVAAAGSALVVAGVRRKGRDEAYLGLTPGVVPATGQQASVGAAQQSPVAVAFQPPKGTTPGEIGTLMDASADNRDVTATMIDLAVRGHMKITPGEGKKQFTFTREQSNDPLLPYEADLLNMMFLSQTTITEKDLGKEDRAKVLPDTRTNLYDRVTKQLHWFRTSPQAARAAAIALAVVLVLAGLGVGALLGAMAGWGLVGLGLVVPGLVLLALHNKISVRSPEGSAVLAQAKGFELYLTTAEADQIKFEEGIDVFSRYLPYAIIFGVADRWVKIFQDLAAKGIYEGDTSWYGGTTMGYFYGAGLASSFDALTSSMSSAMNSAVSAANSSSAGGGGSGFSGGGGFGGGGGGSW